MPVTCHISEPRPEFDHCIEFRMTVETVTFMCAEMHKIDLPGSPNTCQLQ